jgi:hypothetical protein
MFSLYNNPITNIYPERDISLIECYHLIKSGYKEETKHLRSIKDASIYRTEKANRLDFVTFAGTFSKRAASSLIELSGLMCVDLDHLHNLPAKKRKIKADPVLSVKMIFVSPGGDGLKIIIDNPVNSGNYKNDYEHVRAHFWRRYGLKADATSDVARACFLCYDPEIWINENILIPEGSTTFEAIKKYSCAEHLNYHEDLEESGYYSELLRILDEQRIKHNINFD